MMMMMICINRYNNDDDAGSCGREALGDRENGVPTDHAVHRDEEDRKPGHQS